ncbi:uncharacterized protein N0V89_000128 [Didymosphaeria variabile]|uniref:Uncharacterized protein n=1 Tax=Didymosphaeria variabile TaxID=1932322 RepID=A0A9W8XUJ9_9PLEO|nr:uncharacterized protein N0V89_000128 [Didymosphaeria variabile]KAJ4359573.1 hypothetical protein N0V89_000128 [Didymosphaeria variabile]
MPSGFRHIPAKAPTYHPIQDPATAEWGLTIKRADYDKLLEGFRPRDMDDKWLCITDKPDAQGNTTVHWYRSWTDTEQYAITVQVGDSNKAEGNDWAKLAKITWEKELGSLEVPAEEAKESAVNLCRGFMGCELENAGASAK